MNCQYLQEIGSSSGIWVRMGCKNPKKSLRGAIIRKPLSFYHSSYKTSQNTTCSSMPRFSLDESLREGKKRRSIHNVCSTPAEDFDQYEAIEIIGTNKFQAEAEFVKGIQGKKTFLKNHFLNDDGEGEPAKKEEVL